MRMIKIILHVLLFSLVLNVSLVSTQVQETFKDKALKTPTVGKKSDGKRISYGHDFSESEFESPFRWIVLENRLVYEDDEKIEKALDRNIDVLMLRDEFNEKNLRYVFNYLSNDFPDPISLEIVVHTSLMTIETPEEARAHSSHSGRSRFYQLHKTAAYYRSDDGSTQFYFDTGESGKFVRKSVKLPKRISTSMKK